MLRAVFSGRALQDVERLHGFLVDKNERAAAKAVAEIRAALKKIEQFPASGRPVKDALGDARDWTFPFGAGAYIVRYRIDPEQITVLRVRHSLEAGF